MHFIGILVLFRTLEVTVRRIPTRCGRLQSIVQSVAQSVAARLACVPCAPWPGRPRRRGGRRRVPSLRCAVGSSRHRGVEVP